MAKVATYQKILKSYSAAKLFEQIFVRKVTFEICASVVLSECTLFLWWCVEWWSSHHMLCLASRWNRPSRPLIVNYAREEDPLAERSPPREEHLAGRYRLWDNLLLSGIAHRERSFLLCTARNRSKKHTWRALPKHKLCSFLWAHESFNFCHI